VAARCLSGTHHGENYGQTGCGADCSFRRRWKAWPPSSCY